MSGSAAAYILTWLLTMIAIIDAYLLDETSSLRTPVLIKMLPACKVAASEKVIDSYDDLFEAMPEMGAEMRRVGCECALPEYCFTQYLEQGQRERVAIRDPDSCEENQKVRMMSGSYSWMLFETMRGRKFAHMVRIHGSRFLP